MKAIIIASLCLLSIISPLIAQQTCVRQLSTAQRAAVAQAHNTWRNKVAGGQQSSARGVLPQASNMKTIIYDTNIEEKLSQVWANTNPKGHNPTRVVPGLAGYIGENIYWSSRGTSQKLTPGSFDVSAAVNSWFNEVSLFNGDVSKFSSSATTGGAIGHFTQVIWAESTRVGCGILDCVTSTPKTGYTMYSQSVAFVCNYWKGGNYLGQSIYKTGAPGSGCTNGLSTTFPALCA